MFKYLPDVPVSSREVIVGAIGTAFLFAAGKFLLGIYLGKASVGSTYGAAGSLVAVVIWIYYSAQIFFSGLNLPTCMPMRNENKVVTYIHQRQQL